MTLPFALQQAIEKELNSHKRSSLKESASNLSSRYLQHGKDRTSYMRNADDRLAYIAARMPATYAACSSVFKEVAARLNTPAHTILDLGSGPGTALFAASTHFPFLQKMTAIEQDSELSTIGKRLIQHSAVTSLRETNYLTCKLENALQFPPHDLVTLSYVLGELDPKSIPSLIEKAFAAANHALIIIEPGTPAGFERIRLVRDQLISLKGQMIAPCPHMLECPMKEGNWCHFAERLERSSTHRTIKEGTLNYEDEKFSYVAFSKTEVKITHARILRHPLKRSGHIQFTLCTKEGLKTETISKKEGIRYKLAKDAEWGDSAP